MLVGVVACCAALDIAVGAQTTNTSAQSRTDSTEMTTQPANTQPAQALDGLVGTGSQNPFLGSNPSGEVTPGVMQLSATDAIDRGLRYNLGLLLSRDQTESVRGARYRALADLLPNVTAQVSATEEQISLAALGFPATAATQFGVPSIVGPFNVFDARAFATQSVLDLVAINKTRAATENVRAAEWNYRNAREIVVLVVGGEYLAVIADGSRVQAAQAQFDTAQVLYRQTVDLHNAGIVAAIDVLRAQVEMQAFRQRLVAARNQLDKQKLALARVIGLPQAQQFALATDVPYSPAPPTTIDEALQRAFKQRPDYQQAQALEASAQRSRDAAVAEYYPSLQVSGDYGVIGPHVSNSHGTFTLAGGLKIPIFEGGRVHGKVLQADALLRQRRQEMSDLRTRIENDLRTSLLDINSAAELVQVAQGTVTLAEQQLVQARDRFAAGIADNIQVVQAQEAVATAHENFISSLNAHNLAKLNLARSLGSAEVSTKAYLGGK
jgi:outer membrane protein TolC